MPLLENMWVSKKGIEGGAFGPLPEIAGLSLIVIIAVVDAVRAIPEIAHKILDRESERKWKIGCIVLMLGSSFSCFACASIPLILKILR